MEDERKKRKNKKKKNKQGKTTNEITPCTGEVINADQNHVNEKSQVLDIPGVQNAAVKTNVEGPCTSGTEGSLSGETGKLCRTDREANLEKTIERLQEEKNAYMLKEASLEATIAKLQLENDIYIQEKASLENRILLLDMEKDTTHQRGADFEEKTHLLMDEIKRLNTKEVSLLEKIKQLEREHDSWVENENSAKGTIARMDDDNKKLQTQVMELEESRKSLLQENLRWKEITSDLQSQIQDLEKNASGNDELNTQLEAARELVAKLVAENSELVEKVNNLYVELDHQGIAGDPSLDAGSELPTGTASSIHMADPVSEHSESSSSGDKMTTVGNVVDPNERNGVDDVNAKEAIHLASPMSEFNQRDNVSSKMTESLEDIPIGAEREVPPYNYREDSSVIPILPDSLDSEEIVQIPLDENETANQALQPNNDDDQVAEEVPLIDAPIIGAPFRFISFMARYVSGADLVDKNSAAK